MGLATARDDRSAMSPPGEGRVWPAVDPGSPVPLYHQVHNAILHAIRSGVVQPGDALPTEAELCEAFSVSRITVRQALADLVAAGHLRRDRPRAPLLVRSAPIEQRLARLTAFFFADAFSQGHAPRFVVRNVARVRADGRLEPLGLAESDVVTRVERMLVDRDEPLALLTSYLPERTCPDLSGADFSGSLVPILEERCGVRLAEATQWLSARLATAEERQALAMTAPAVVVEIRRLTRGEDGAPVEFLVCVFRSDRYEFVMDVPST